MAEVRIKLPEEGALALYTQATCDGRISDLVLGDEVEVSMVKIEEADQASLPVSFTKVVSTEDGPLELVTQECFYSFAEQEIKAQKGEGSRSIKSLATRAYNSLMRGIDERYIYRTDRLRLGFKADYFEEIIQRIKESPLSIPHLGEGSKDFLCRFGEAFTENREAQHDAVESQLVGLGTVALTTQRHELEMKLGLEKS